jgi:CubicO group peptidase (beta-lactamase class C family)
MNGFWISTNGLNNVYFSNARSMARFGLLNLNNGIWDDTPILSDDTFKTAMRNSSQDLNQSYGYLWWLNGKESYMVPGSRIVSPGYLIPNAPASTYAGLGKNDQKLYLVPDQNLVVIRLGNDAGEDKAGPSSFDNELWGRLKELIGY